MQQQGVMTNVITYSALISACEKGNQPEQALGLLQEMVDQLLIPNVVSFSACISASEKGKQWERALEVVETMQRQVVMPNVITHNAYISASEKGKQPVMPDVITYNASSVPVKRASSQSEPWRCCRQCSSKAQCPTSKSKRWPPPRSAHGRPHKANPDNCPCAYLS